MAVVDTLRHADSLHHLDLPYPIQRCSAAGPRAPQKSGVRGTAGFDGLERISTQTLMDILEVPQRKRTAGKACHSSELASAFEA
jgi:hypothetical protein